ncbi:MAG TPA: thioesterase family protein [Acidimicrobiia bacterium]
MKFGEASAVRKVDAGSYTAEIQEGWDIFGVSNGGYLLATLARAMGEEALGRDLVSISARFLNPGRAGQARIEVETLKEGRGTTTLQGRMLAGDRPLFVAHATFAVPGMGVPIDISYEDAPSVPPPDQCVRLLPVDDRPLPPPFADKVEILMRPEDAVMGDAAEGRSPDIKGWFRLLGGELIDPYGLVLAADAFPPAVFTANLPMGWTPTIDLSVYVRDPGPHEIVKSHVHTRHITGGWLEEDVEMWDTAGNLVAQSRQLALLAR